MLDSHSCLQVFVVPSRFRIHELGVFTGRPVYGPLPTSLSYDCRPHFPDNCRKHGIRELSYPDLQRVLIRFTSLYCKSLTRWHLARYLKYGHWISLRFTMWVFNLDVIRNVVAHFVTRWLLLKLVPARFGLKEPLTFLLDHPRRCFVYLFPSHQTWFLFSVVLGLM